MPPDFGWWAPHRLQDNTGFHPKRSDVTQWDEHTLQRRAGASTSFLYVKMQMNIHTYIPLFSRDIALYTTLRHYIIPSFKSLS